MLSLFPADKTYVRSKTNSRGGSDAAGLGTLSMKYFPLPQRKKQVRVFLGLAGYYRRFIPDYASITAPPTDLPRKAAPNQVLWSASVTKLSST